MWLARFHIKSYTSYEEGSKEGQTVTVKGIVNSPWCELCVLLLQSFLTAWNSFLSHPKNLYRILLQAVTLRQWVSPWCVIFKNCKRNLPSSDSFMFSAITGFLKYNAFSLSDWKGGTKMCRGTMKVFSTWGNGCYRAKVFFWKQKWQVYTRLSVQEYRRIHEAFLWNWE